MTTLDNAPASKPGDLNQLENELREAVTFSKAATAKQGTQDGTIPAPAVDDIPEKFRGKSLSDVVDMYKNLESVHGRTANDLGVQRQLTDRLLDLKRSDDLTRNTPKPAVQVRSDELLENPTQTIEKVVSQRVDETRNELNQRLQQLEQRLASERFISKHPDYLELANKSDFQDWVRESAYRQRAAAAVAQGDPIAADELITEYKAARKGNKADKSEAIESARKVGLEGSQSQAPTSSGKIYRRSDLIRLKVERPEVYGDHSFQAEIMQAYAEGRVK